MVSLTNAPLAAQSLRQRAIPNMACFDLARQVKDRAFVGAHPVWRHSAQAHVMILSGTVCPVGLTTTFLRSGEWM
jgi:hypothetical protein